MQTNKTLNIILGIIALVLIVLIVFLLVHKSSPAPAVSGSSVTKIPIIPINPVPSQSSSTSNTNTGSGTSTYSNAQYGFQMQLLIGVTMGVNEYQGNVDISPSGSGAPLKYLRAIHIATGSCQGGAAATYNGISFLKTAGSGAFGGMESGSIDGFYCANHNGLAYTITFSDEYDRVDPGVVVPDQTATELEFDHEMNLLNFKFTDATTASTVSQPITLSSVSPNPGTVGTQLTINGSGFIVVPPAALQQSADWMNTPHVQVVITSYPNDAFAKRGYLWLGNPTNDSSISFTIPSRICATLSNPCNSYTIITPGVYTITAIGFGQQQSNGLRFTVTGSNVSAAPSITSLSPSSAKVGDTVKIFGNNFTGDEGINIGNVPQYTIPTYVSPDGTELDFIVPPSSVRVAGNTYPLVLSGSNGGTISNSVSFTLLP